MTRNTGKRMKTLAAGAAITCVLGGGVAAVLLPGVANATVAARGADDAVGHIRQARGADDPVGHIRQARGADDPVGHVRHGRGADDAVGHVRQARGADDRVRL